MKKDLTHGRTASDVKKKLSDKKYQGERVVDPKDIEREYVKGHFKSKNVDMKTPTKRLKKKANK